MKIGLIDCDNKNPKNIFPNLALMKLSAYHKQIGDEVVWYDPMFTGHCDIVYVSKVFSFSEDFDYFIDSDKVIYGGSGFAIKLVEGKEVYDKEKDLPLPYEIEHIYPDYSIYGITDTAYGFLSRGCPRGCDFCHIKNMQGQVSRKVADLSEFWNGQKKIVLLDPNITACTEWKEIFQQLIDSKANVNFSQGLDIRLLNKEKIEMLKQIKCTNIHFAWDNYKDKELIISRIKLLKELTQWNRRKIIIYVLCNFNTTIEQDLERIYTLRQLECYPYITLYNKNGLKKGSIYKKIQRWVNNRFIWEACETLEEYMKGKK